MTYKPTDQELDALRQAENGDLNFVTLRQFRIIARAVLAKWGTPVVALTAQAISKAPDHVAEVGNMVEQAISAEQEGVPAATVIKRGADREWMSERLGHLPDGVYSLYLAAPQPSPSPAPAQPDLGTLNGLAKQYADSYASPHHFTLGVNGLRQIIQRALPQAAQQASAHVLHLVQDAFAEVAMAYPKAFALHKVGLADTAVRKALAAPSAPQAEDTGAVPLTAEQAQDLIDLESWGPEAISLNAQLLRTIRRTETAHGIKGGGEC